MQKVVNLTPNVIDLYRDEQHIAIPPSGIVARVKMSVEEFCRVNIEGLTVPVVAYDPLPTLDGLPAGFQFEEDTIYLVSPDVLSVIDLCPELTELYGEAWLFATPDTSPASVVRDQAGRVIGVQQLVGC